ncbi:MAG: FadR family transcriptional regulator [Chloroflexi bacterium]|nr:FadR family transcriptional regulator [Chloroflexota bacterium]
MTVRPLAGLTPIEQRRESVTTEVARKLLDYLLAGRFQPGQRLPGERQLAEALGVGRSVVREALKSLTLLGLIEVRQGSGTYLKSAESDLLPQVVEWGLLLGAKRTRDLVEARRHLEVVVAGLAAQRRDADALADLEAQVARMRAADPDDPDAFVAADVAFHLRIADAAGNETLYQVMASVRALLQVWISRVMRGADARFLETAHEHELIYEAIRDQDDAAARSAMEAHMESAYIRLGSTLTDDGQAVLLSVPAGRG